jgi:hypothetical protein
VQNHGSTPTESEAQFQEAAREVVAEASPPSPSVPSPASIAEKLQALTVSEEHAREVVKACFWPMAHYVDPLWALSDGEAQKATPQMQTFLQWLLMKYAPLFTLQLAARFPEILGLAVALAFVAWHKSQIIMAAQRSTATASQPQSVAVAGEVPAWTREPSSEFQMPCEVCGANFPSRQALADHLPCNPV